MKKTGRLLSLLLALAVILSALPLQLQAEEPESLSDVTILYTNDIHGKIEGFSVLAGYKQQLKDDGHHVITVDAGDAIQGELPDSLTRGEASTVLMEKAGYDLAVPGNHEFDYTVPRFLELAEGSSVSYLAANFSTTEDNALIFDSYSVIEMNGRKIGFVGICTPETYTKSTPTYFMDDDGNYLYSFGEDRLYELVQNAVDAARKDGAEVVIALGHTGMKGTAEKWNSAAIIANTEGIDAYIDAHSHEEIPGPDYNGSDLKNKNGAAVPETSTGTKFANIGKMDITFTESGVEITTGLVKKEDAQAAIVSDTAKAEYERVQGSDPSQEGTVAFYAEKEEAYNRTAIGTSEADMYIYDPDGGKRMVRSRETNLGDFVADAFRSVLNTDISLVNGGGVRVNLEAGEVTMKELVDVCPFGNTVGVAIAKGQVILDALEHGARSYPGENGGFLQVSGLSYAIDTSIPSPVVTKDDGSFDHIDPEAKRRVSCVKIGSEMLDPEKEYSIAATTYMLRDGGDGMTMFKNCKLIEDIRTDADMLIDYLTSDEYLGGVIPAELYGTPYGEGRIAVVGENEQLMYRVYNPNSGEHFYTAKEKEMEALVGYGWQLEGFGWKAPGKGDPVYRLYNANGKEHHYTLNEKEKDALVSYGWTYEGIGWHSAGSDGRAVLREYNPNAYSCNHNYTTNKKEHDALTGKLGWKDEGIGWYAAY
ncbi:MAG: 5'-nucleotidase C-terminal domain-containing protein [Solobacterium sp.]|nr:5'-nucleotidase C-terminal domain-containing protein [Solobacterium sp.]